MLADLHAGDEKQNQENEVPSAEEHQQETEKFMYPV